MNRSRKLGERHPVLRRALACSEIALNRKFDTHFVIPSTYKCSPTTHPITSPSSWRRSPLRIRRRDLPSVLHHCPIPRLRHQLVSRIRGMRPITRDLTHGDDSMHIHQSHLLASTLRSSHDAWQSGVEPPNTRLLICIPTRDQS